MVPYRPRRYFLVFGVLGDVRRESGKYNESVCKLLGRCPESIRKVSGKCKWACMAPEDIC